MKIFIPESSPHKCYRAQRSCTLRAEYDKASAKTGKLDIGSVIEALEIKD